MLYRRSTYVHMYECTKVCTHACTHTDTETRACTYTHITDNNCTRMTLTVSFTDSNPIIPLIRKLSANRSGLSQFGLPVYVRYSRNPRRLRIFVADAIFVFIVRKIYEDRQNGRRDIDEKSINEKSRLNNKIWCFFPFIIKGDLPGTIKCQSINTNWLLIQDWDEKNVK